ncbi:MAG: GDP-mannose 4,6-dehydratase [Aureliella sp.]
MAPIAMITGASGQDGALLMQLLTTRGYVVHTISRSHTDESSKQGSTTTHALNKSDSAVVSRRLSRLIRDIQPDEIYHFASDSFIPNSWDSPLENLEVNAGLTIAILEAVRHHSPKTRVLNACSREIFGHAFEGRVNEETAMRPTTPYGINKASARWMVHAYRERYGLFASNAILFNHESPLRKEEFVTRKISRGVAQIIHGLRSQIELGCLTARRDWGYAGDFVDAMWRMLQIDSPEDFVIGTGQTHSIEDFASAAFGHVGLEWKEHVTTNPSFARSNDRGVLSADCSKAKKLLDWQPTTTFDELVAMMVEADLASVVRSGAVEVKPSATESVRATQNRRAA